MINPLLQRQLQATGLTSEALPANDAAWLDFLTRLSLDYDSLCQSSDTELERRLRETLLLNRALAATSSALEPTAILTILCEELARAFDVPQAAATLLSEDGKDLRGGRILRTRAAFGRRRGNPGCQQCRIAVRAGAAQTAGRARRSARRTPGGDS
ncbi:hypothetical protein [Candidatus Amarolinea dominans]|uniref:hypothetical protein n=1 Tax=Candidatus Amarolinea dominans TaxID=3140696 RepID=UPI001D6FC1A3|nr:hypothetical protein [Anaerolineae bacterium]